VGADETAYPHRDTPFQYSTSTRWALDEDPEQHIRWSRDTWERLAPFSSGGVYVNWTSDDTVGSTELAYRHNLARLRGLKRTYDPANFFRGGLNLQDSL
jgi:FAD/FMN-containing dehydrogenase